MIAVLLKIWDGESVQDASLFCPSQSSLRQHFKTSRCQDTFEMENNCKEVSVYIECAIHEGICGWRVVRRKEGREKVCREKEGREEYVIKETCEKYVSEEDGRDCTKTGNVSF